MAFNSRNTWRNEIKTSSQDAHLALGGATTLEAPQVESSNVGGRTGPAVVSTGEISSQRPILKEWVFFFKNVALRKLLFILWLLGKKTLRTVPGILPGQPSWTCPDTAEAWMIPGQLLHFLVYLSMPSSRESTPQKEELNLSTPVSRHLAACLALHQCTASTPTSELHAWSAAPTAAYFLVLGPPLFADDLSPQTVRIQGSSARWIAVGASLRGNLPTLRKSYFHSLKSQSHLCFTSKLSEALCVCVCVRTADSRAGISGHICPSPSAPQNGILVFSLRDPFLWTWVNVLSYKKESLSLLLMLTRFYNPKIRVHVQLHREILTGWGRNWDCHK